MCGSLADVGGGREREDGVPAAAWHLVEALKREKGGGGGGEVRRMSGRSESCWESSGEGGCRCLGGGCGGYRFEGGTEGEKVRGEGRARGRKMGGDEKRVEGGRGEG